MDVMGRFLTDVLQPGVCGTHTTAPCPNALNVCDGFAQPTGQRSIVTTALGANGGTPIGKKLQYARVLFLAHQLIA